MKHSTIIRALGFFLSLCPLLLTANNIQVSNIRLTEQDINASTIKINFDLTWDNSWRISSGPSNWDAAWVFAKFRRPGNSWQHVNLNYVDGTNDGHSVPSGATIQTMSDQKGCFVYRNMDGSGDVQFNNVGLLWSYGAVGISDDASIEVKVFAIEMVYVPQGAFSLGNGFFSDETNRFYRVGSIPLANSAYPVSSEDAIVVGGTGNLFYTNLIGTFGGDQLGPIPAAFPKGYDAFYCMKYELSQAQYVSFFNTLSPTQKIDRDISNGAHKGTDDEVQRNGFAWGDAGNATTTLPDVPMNYINITDIVAYLDWSGLRPITEMEFEKACRGTQSAVQNEFAWGNAEIWQPLDLVTIINEGTPNELISNPSAEESGVTYLGTAQDFIGPRRCGIHAASAINKNRIEAGATYYGIMEMSGNLYERAVTVGTPDGRSYTGEHGDGVLTINGEANVTNWPSATATGLGARGGGFLSEAADCATSDRFFAALANSDGSSPTTGTRGVRTAE